MSEKNVVLSNQASLTEIQIDKVEEILEHLVKSQSMIDVITNSIEGKNTDNKLDLASELNSMITVYDELEHAISDATEVLNAVKGVEAIDQKDD